MFIEIANRPKHVIIQKCTKANKWVDIAEISDRCGMDYDYLSHILRTYDLIDIGLDWRVVVRSKKNPAKYRQVLSLSGLQFYATLRNDMLVSLILKKDAVGNVADYSQPILYSLANNPHFKSANELREYIFNHGGIAKVHRRPYSTEDSYLVTFDITFNNGTEVTVSQYFTYTD